MDVDPSIYPTVAHIDHSPTGDSLSLQDLFSQAYYADVYATLSARYLDSVNNTLSSSEMPTIKSINLRPPIELD
jgi:hypothetical protein